MPRLPNEVLDCVIHVYSDPNTAKEGIGGATGFIVGVRSCYETNYLLHLYAVTNRHAIFKAGANPVLRFNTRGGAIQILETKAGNWRFHVNGDDLAAFPIHLSAEHQFSYVGTELLLKEGELSGWIGPGTETVMVGRFVSHEGKQRNTPALRFGNTAMMPVEPILDAKSGLKHDSFLVEMRSIPGCSGSPVFAVILPMAIRGYEVIHSKPTPPPTALKLIGVDWCHLSDFRPVLQLDCETKVSEGWKVESNSGMAGVVPAWKLRELIDSEELKKERIEIDKQKYEERENIEKK